MNLFNNQNRNQSTQNSQNILLRGSVDQIQLNGVKVMLNYVTQCQKGQQLHWAINTLELQYRQIIQSMNQCAKIEDGMLYDDQFIRQVRQRCMKIKKDNETIMMLLFNFKENMRKLNSNTLQVDVDKQNQYTLVQQKIRRVKMQIINKLQKLKTIRNSKKTKNKKAYIQPSHPEYRPPMKLALVQLKDAVQVVNKQLIKQRLQIKMIIKELYDKDV